MKSPNTNPDNKHIVSGHTSSAIIDAIIRATQCLSIVFFLSACSTFEFVNGPELNQTTIHESWHHQGINGLINFSKPLNVKAQCGQQQWESVTIEETFFNGISGVSHPVINLYAPWTIIYECREAIDTVH
jgi:hypothetical protein